MATTDTQSIPPELADLYRTIFDPTPPAGIARTQGNNPIGQHYPATGFIKDWRAAFAHVAQLVELQEYQESHCWYVLAESIGADWWALFMRDQIRRVYNGVPDEAIQSPHAAVYDHSEEFGTAFLTFYEFGIGPHTLTYEFTGDPITAKDPEVPATKAQYIITEQYNAIINGQLTQTYTTHLAVNPTQRTTYRGTIELPSRIEGWREITWWRNTEDLTGESVCWKLQLETPLGLHHCVNMTPLHPYGDGH